MRRARTSVRLLAAALAFATIEAFAKPLEVRILGVDGELRDNVEAMLEVADFDEVGEAPREDGDEADDADEQDGDAAEAKVEAEEEEEQKWIEPARLRRLHARAPGRIRAALVPFGYYRPQIETALEEQDDQWLATYRVEAGPPTLLDEVEILIRGEGRDDTALRSVLEAIELEPGDRLLHPRYEDAKRALFDAAYRAGYLDARWARSELRIGPDRENADVHLVLDTGPLFRFGEVTFEQDVLDPDFVSRFVTFEPGERYDVQKLLDLQLALSQSEYFDRIEIEALRDEAGADHRVPIRVATQPSKPQRYSVALGYATDTGPRTNLGVLLRRLNPSGHRFRADLQLSEVKSSASLRYEIPVDNVATDTLAFTASAQEEEVSDAKTDQYLVGVSLNDGWYGFRRRLYLEASRENFQFGGGPNEVARLLVPGMTLTRERADDLVFPVRGYGVTMDLRGGLESVVSEASFVRADLDARWVRGIAPNTRLLLHAGAGALMTDQFNRLPPSQRFFAGGDRSLRGHEFQGVGPTNDNGDVIGGKYRVLGSVEVDRLLWGNYGAAVFFDAGDAFDSSPDLKRSVGVGFRWRSPIGMARLDLAHPLDDSDDSFRIHVTIGPEF